MSVIIKIDTGFVGAVHEEDTGLSIDEWNRLTSKEKDEMMQMAVVDNIEVYAVNDEDDELVD